jgi:putative PIN family toxin of toxin-antitoxin system
MDSTERVVYDCNIYFQALISPRGPAGACVTAAFDGRVVLFCSTTVVKEIRRTAQRPELSRKFSITEERVSLLIENVEKVARFVESVPEVFVYPRDPDDAHYVNLALATSAAYIVTRDNDLLDLADNTKSEGRLFQSRFPQLRILGPADLLAILARNPYR